MASLTLFLAMPDEDCQMCNTLGKAPARLVGRHGYIGLRERAQDALERASMVSSELMDKSNHVGLRIQFTTLGLAHYMTTCAGVQHAFAPVLTKKTYYNDETDWKVWHLLGDLPLRHVTPSGEPYLTTEWMHIS